MGASCSKPPPTSVATGTGIPASRAANSSNLPMDRTEFEAMKQEVDDLREAVKQLQAAQQDERPHQESQSASDIVATSIKGLKPGISNDDVPRQLFSLSQSIGKMQHHTCLEDLKHLLLQWRTATTSSERGMVTTSIRRLYVREYSLLVSDMSGFTRITKVEGICHFLMLIKIMQAKCIPIMLAFGGRLVKAEADNLFVVFSAPKAAVLAAMHCQSAVALYNVGKRKNDQIHLSMGVVHGEMFHIPGVDVFGGVVPVGFVLGEDAAAEDETLVAEAVYKHAKAQRGMEGIEFEEAAPFEDGEEELATWRVKLDPSRPPIEPRVAGFQMPVVNTQVNSEEPIEFITLMQRRMHFPEEAAQIDEHLHALFTEHCAVVVIDLHFERQNDEAIDDADLQLLSNILSGKALAERVIKKYLGDVVASMHNRTAPVVFALLPDAASALSAALEFANLCRIGEIDACLPRIGISIGDVLNLSNHNAFGDAVNVAFKLGEDIGKHWEILIDSRVKKHLEDKASAFGRPDLGWPLVKTTEKVSGVTLHFFKLNFMSEEARARAASLETRVSGADLAVDPRKRRAGPRSRQTFKPRGVGQVFEVLNAATTVGDGSFSLSQSFIARKFIDSLRSTCESSSSFRASVRTANSAGHSNAHSPTLQPVLQEKELTTANEAAPPATAPPAREA